MWYLSLGDEANAVLGWPAILKQHSSGAYNHFVMDTEGSPTFFSIIDLDEWEGLSW